MGRLKRLLAGVATLIVLALAFGGSALAAGIRIVPSATLVSPGEDFYFDVVADGIPAEGLGGFQFRLNVTAPSGAVLGVADLSQAGSRDIAFSSPLLASPPTSTRSGLGSFFWNGKGPNGILVMDNELLIKERLPNDTRPTEQLTKSSALYTFAHTNGSIPPNGSGPLARFVVRVGAGRTAERIDIGLSEVMLLDGGPAYPLDYATGASVQVRCVAQVPALTGLNLAQAQEALAATNLILGTVSEIPNPGNLPYGVVLAQSTTAGSSLTCETAVDLSINNAPNLAIAPVASPTTLASQVIGGTMSTGATVSVTSGSGTTQIGPVSYPDDTSWSCTIERLDAGTNLIQVSAVDANGDRATASATIDYHPLSVSFTPATLASDYQGTLQLKVQNLPAAGSAALVEQYVDANHNGVIDSDDPLVRSFTVTDGTASANPNLPGDADGAGDGALTSSLGYFNTSDLYHAAGNYLFRVTSGTSTAVAAFNVTAAGYAQEISGTVSVDGTPVPGALVRLTDTWQRPVAFALADAAGHYLLKVKDPGDYLLIPAAYGKATPAASRVPVSLTSGQSLVSDLGLAAGTFRLSGQLKDAATGAGIAGVWIEAAGAGEGGLAITGADGSYQMQLAAGTYSVAATTDCVGPAPFGKGYLVPAGQPLSVALNADLPGQDLILAKGSVLASGRLVDESGQGAAGMTVEARLAASADPREPLALAVTDAEGAYTLSLSPAENWTLAPGSDAAQARGYLGASITGFSSVSGPATGNDLRLHAITDTVQGTVKDIAGRPVQGLRVLLHNADGSQSASVRTAANGSYRLGAYAGEWLVSALTAEQGYLPLAEHSVTLPATPASVDFTAYQALPTLSPTSLPYGRNGVSYSQALTCAGGVAPYRYSVLQAALPDGLSLDADSGVLSGTPSQNNTTSTFTVRCTDANGLAAKQDYSVTVHCMPVAPVVFSPVGVVVTAVPQLTFGASCGTAVVKVDGAAVNKANGELLDLLSDGVHALAIVLTNQVGDTAQFSGSFTVDTAPPVTTATPPAGTYYAAQSLSLATTRNAVIHYTTNGSIPTAASPIFSAPIPIAATMTLKFFGQIPGGSSETVRTASYVIDTSAPVTTASPLGGSYATPQTVILATTKNATIHYTLDGSNPGPGSPVYSVPIAVSSSLTLKYVAEDSGGNRSVVQTQVYTIDGGVLTTVATPPGGSYDTTQMVTLTANHPATIYYTLDGSTPTTSSAVYSGPIPIVMTNTLKFFAREASGNTEIVHAQTYTIGCVKYAESFNGAGVPAGWSLQGTSRIDSHNYHGDANSMMVGDGWSGDGSATFVVPVTGDLIFWYSKTSELGIYYQSGAVPDPNGHNAGTMAVSINGTQVFSNSADTGWTRSPVFHVTAGDTVKITQTGTNNDIGLACGFGEYICQTGPYALVSVSVDDVTIHAGTCGDTAAPTSFATPAGKTYCSPQKVELQADEPADIYYTTDGSTPNVLSTRYIGALENVNDVTIKFFARDPVGNTGSVKTESYANHASGLPVTAASPAGGTYYVAQSVTLSASKGTIYYATDGTIPTTASAVYTAPIPVTAGKTIKFFAKDECGNVEAVQSQSYIIDTTPPITTATPPTGTYGATLTVTLTTTKNAVIYYTTNGVLPTTSSTVYTGPITIASTCNLMYFAKVPGGATETVKSQYYTIDRTPPSTYATPSSGTYYAPQSVTLQTTKSATIYYTTDGSIPTASSPVYTGPINIGSTTTLKCFGQVPGGPAETVRTVTYTLDFAAPVTTATPPGGTFNQVQRVALSATKKATIYYTTDGSVPTISSPVYQAPILLTRTTTLKYLAKDSGGNTESVKAQLYTINDSTAPVTTFTPPGGTYSQPVTVTLTSDEPAAIYYTLDGSTPSVNSTVYSGPITIASTKTLKFLSRDLAGNSDIVRTQTYVMSPAAGYQETFDNQTLPTGWQVTGVASIDGSAFHGASNSLLLGDHSLTDGAVTFQAPVSGRLSFWYSKSSDWGYYVYGNESWQEVGNVGWLTVSVNGTAVFMMPDDIGWTQAPLITVHSGDTVTIAQTGNYDDFGAYCVSIGRCKYDEDPYQHVKVNIDDVAIVAVDSTAPTTTATPSGGDYCSPQQQVQLLPDEPATVYFTTDGSTPTSASAKYSAPLTIGGTTTLKYFAKDPAGNSEPVKTELYLAGPPVSAVSPAAGSYCSPQTIAFTTNKGTIHCTTDGSTPTINSPVCSGTLLVDKNTAVNYFSVDGCGNAEAVHTAVYLVDTSAPVVNASPADGSYFTAQTVTLSSNKPATIYYTLDGTPPTTASAAYSTPLNVDRNMVLKYVAKDLCGNLSAVGSQIYSIGQAFTVNPVTSPTTSPTQLMTGTIASGWTVAVSVNGALVPVTTNQGTWSSELGLAPGSNSIQATARDSAGNQQGNYHTTVERVTALTGALSLQEIPSDYVGLLTLSVSLPNPGGTVTVEQFVAPEGGVLAGGSTDFLIRSLKVTDGAVSVLGPHDADGLANGSISLELDYRLISDIYHAPGSYLFRISDGTTSVVVPFTVVPLVTDYQITGTVYDQNYNGGMPRTLVRLVDRKSDATRGFALTDSQGHYTHNVSEAGEYRLIPIGYYDSGSVTQEGVDGIFDVNIAPENYNPSADLVMHWSDWSITGRVTDAANGAGIAGIWIQAKNDEFSGFAITNSDGNYVLQMPAGIYRVSPSVDLNGPSLFGKGYLHDNRYMMVDLTVTDSAGIDFTALPGNQLVTGRVSDPDGNGYVGMGIPVQIGTDQDHPAYLTVSSDDGSFTLALPGAAEYQVSLGTGVNRSTAFTSETLTGISAASAAQPLQLKIYPVTP